MIDDFDRTHVLEILDQPSAHTWFSAQLIRLIAKADDGNRERLRKGFPEHVAAFEDFYFRRGHYAPANDGVSA